MSIMLTAPVFRMREILAYRQGRASGPEGFGRRAGQHRSCDRPDDPVRETLITPETGPMSHNDAQAGPVGPAAKRMMQASSDAVVTS